MRLTDTEPHVDREPRGDAEHPLARCIGSPLVGVTGKLENINFRADWARVTAPGLRKIGDRVFTVYSTGYYIHN